MNIGITKMLFGSLGAFTMGLLFISFSKSIRCNFSIGLSDHPRVLSLDDSGYSINSHEASANDDTNDVPPQHCNRTQKLMSITFSEEFENMKKEFSSSWNDYVTVPWGRQWRTTDLTYSIHNYGGEDEDDVNTGVKKAYGKWSAAAPRLKFTQLRDGVSAHMNIRFVKKLKNAEGNSLLGATDLPNEGNGDIQLNADTDWKFYSDTSSREHYYPHVNFPFYGQNTISFAGWDISGHYAPSKTGFVCLATHEIGHALGLRHSEDTDAVMHPDYDCDGTTDVDLDDDDIKAIRYLYPESGSNDQSHSNVSHVRPHGANRGGYPGYYGHVSTATRPVVNRGGNPGNQGGNDNSSSTSSDSSDPSSSDSSDTSD